MVSSERKNIPVIRTNAHRFPATQHPAYAGATPRSERRRLLALGTATLAAAVLLSGCAAAKEAGTEVAEEEFPVAVVDVTAEKSPAATRPAGTVFTLNSAQVPAGTGIDAVVAHGTTLAMRQGDALTIGTLDELTAGAGTVLTIDEGCGQLSAGPDGFVLACPLPIPGHVGTQASDKDSGAVYLIDAQNPSLDKVLRGEQPFNAAVQTNTGAVLAGSVDSPKIAMFPDGATAPEKSYPVESRTDQLIAVPVSGSDDTVAVLNRANAVIREIDWANNQMGAALRSGLAVADMAAGGSDMLLMTDASRKQLMLFTMSPVIRFHQTITIPEGIWAVSWDSAHQVAWVATNLDNKITAWSFSSGVPEKRGELSTIAQVTDMTTLDDGTLVLGNEAGEVETISSAELAAALNS